MSPMPSSPLDLPGSPKGVLNTHEGIVNRLLWMQDAYLLQQGDRCSAENSVLALMSP